MSTSCWIGRPSDSGAGASCATRLLSGGTVAATRTAAIRLAVSYGLSRSNNISVPTRAAGTSYQPAVTSAVQKQLDDQVHRTGGVPGLDQLRFLADRQAGSELVGAANQGTRRTGRPAGRQLEHQIGVAGGHGRLDHLQVEPSFFVLRQQRWRRQVLRQENRGRPLGPGQVRRFGLDPERRQHLAERLCRDRHRLGREVAEQQRPDAGHEVRVQHPLHPGTDLRGNGAPGRAIAHQPVDVYVDRRVGEGLGDDERRLEVEVRQHQVQLSLQGPQRSQAALPDRQVDVPGLPDGRVLRRDRVVVGVHVVEHVEQRRRSGQVGHPVRGLGDHRVVAQHEHSAVGHRQHLVGQGRRDHGQAEARGGEADLRPHVGSTSAIRCRRTSGIAATASRTSSAGS